MCVFFCFFFGGGGVVLLPATGHEMLANRSVDSGSSFTYIPTAGLGSVTFLACCEISPVLFAFRLRS